MSMRRRVAVVSAAFAVLGPLVGLAAVPSATAASHSPSVAYKVALKSGNVVAQGSVRDLVRAERATVALQIRGAHGKWVTRAKSSMTLRRGTTPFALKWAGAPSKVITLRVQVTRGSHTVASGRAQPFYAGDPATVWVCCTDR